ncbi:PilZ domain-containing protein [Shewanella sp. NIFS-20-20]|uniref:PilZ domain-containing protein n=1 Tax=Shewanella sp. NIFS-20-20 TaxID=2853806 RepID=UPI001C46F55A|nr:PilZ domain-containing protein [Shewanella sp. NIFS-20-20]MBV7315168.1 PilZ domain-containing protein [Shewanella sp. NIFS-20-20]
MTIQGFNEQRQSVRIDMEASDLLIVWRQDGQEQQIIAKHSDVSRLGSSFVCSLPFAIGSQLTVVLQSNSPNPRRINGQVLRVSPLEQQYFIAVEFEADA